MGWRSIAMQMILKSSDGLEGLMTCLSDVKAWLSLSCLNFNESKTEISMMQGCLAPEAPACSYD